MDDPKAELMFFLRALIGEVVDDTKKQGLRGRSRYGRMVRFVRGIGRAAGISLTYEEIDRVLQD